MLGRAFVAAATLVGVGALAAACSIYDESLLGAGGGDTGSSETSASGDGGRDGDGGDGGGDTTRSVSVSGTGTESASVSVSGSSGQSGSVTTGGNCQSPDQCPGDDSECAVRTCENGMCSILAEVQGTVLARQTAGDCLLLVCDGVGGIETVNDDQDEPADDGNACTEAVCADGAPDHVPLPERTECAQAGGTLCNAAGDCVECIDGGDCPDETAEDCGGRDCGGCELGEDCLVPTDCLSGDCDGTCQPSCIDGFENNGETDVDCGGANCDPCILGLGCAAASDCDSGYCPDAVCRPQLLFSEYIEGTSSNKVVEIFNAGNQPVNLATANCSVKFYPNGQTTPTATIGLTGTVAEFGVHVLCNNAGISAQCDQSSGSLNHNGNDALTLECATFVLDVFGQIGDDPGAPGWGTDPENSVDNTLRRDCGILFGDRIGSDEFDPFDEFTGFPVNDLAGLGDHCP
jgi:hypothetical protein